MRWGGSKQRRAKDIVRIIPYDIEHYVEPFAGLCSVGRRLIAERPGMKSVLFSDMNADLIAWLEMIRGTHQDHGDFLDRLRDARSRLLPETDHEAEIRAEFEKSKDDWLFNGDPFAWFFLHLYAVGQYVSRHRANIASFDPAYFVHGLTCWTTEKASRWRTLLQRGTIRCGDALTLLRDLNEKADGSYCAYLDPPYIPPDRRFDLYQHELDDEQHRELAEILKVARFRFVLSMGDSPRCRDLYVCDKSFTSPFCTNPGFVCRSLYYTYTGHARKQVAGRGKVGKTNEWLIRNYD